MRKLLLIALAEVLSAPLAFAAQTGATQANKVWTNADLDELRTRGLISIVGIEPGTAAAQATARTPRPYLLTEDPAWYADRFAELRVEFAAWQAAAAQAREQLARARNLRSAEAGVNLTRSNPGITPEEGIAELEARAREMRGVMDALRDLARRNYVEVGALGG